MLAFAVTPAPPNYPFVCLRINNHIVVLATIANGGAYAGNKTTLSFPFLEQCSFRLGYKLLAIILLF
jgi:hypothetical protein